MTVPWLDSLPVVWTPAAGAFEASPVGRMASRYGITDYRSLVERSRADPGWFWSAAEQDLGIVWTRPYSENLDLSAGPEWAKFFRGGRLNISTSAVDKWIGLGRGGRVALRWRSDTGASEMTYDELHALVQNTAAGLAAHGIAKGDVVAILLPMCPEAVAVILAAARIGALTLPLFSGYGPQAIEQRLRDSAAKILVTCDVVQRRGNSVALIDTARAAIERASDIREVVVLRRASASLRRNEIDWGELVSSGAQIEPIECASDDPLMLIYTSGSTGRPKACVHTHAGLPIKVAQEARHGFGIDQDATVLWVTDMGWVMGPWLVFAALLNGGTAVLFEGVPDWPHPGKVWEVADETAASVLGITPTLVRALMAHGSSWPRRYPMASLKAVGSTGEPWNLGPWQWCFENVGKSRVPIINICGGTECGGSILSGSTCTPLKPMSFAGPLPGMAADVVDDDGKSVRGEIGELVVRAPWPGMTKGFWKDDEDRYVDSYWRRWPGIWHHGDFAYVDRDGSWYVLGRSDDVIKVAGKRLGPAEVETVLVGQDGVLEAAAVGCPDEVKGQVLVCFIVAKPGVDDPGLPGRLAGAIQDALGKALRPAAVHIVNALPKTRNGKVMRRVARAAYLGTPLGDLSALEDASTLEEFKALRSALKADPGPSV